jgi:apolipoprotein D and lipocalin family protein
MGSALTLRGACAARRACATLVLGIVPLLSAQAASAATVEPLQPVPSVDLTRYMGHWYQIAFYPNAFQKQCVGNVTADYKLLPYGQVEVINRCAKADGGTDEAQGRARLQQPRLLDIPLSKPYSTARLEVRFAPSLLSWLPLVWAPYWVIQLADDYSYTVVSEPRRQYLWILSRTPTLSPQTYEAIKARLVEQGFDVDKLVM